MWFFNPQCRRPWLFDLDTQQYCPVHHYSRDYDHSGAVPGLDVCSLVSPAAASAALQETATLVPSTSKTTCSYSGSLGTTLTVTVVSTTMTPATFSQEWGTLPGAIAGTKAVEAWSANQLIMGVLAGHDLITIQASQDLLGQGGYMVNFETLAQTIVGLL